MGGKFYVIGTVPLNNIILYQDCCCDYSRTRFRLYIKKSSEVQMRRHPSEFGCPCNVQFAEIRYYP